MLDKELIVLIPHYNNLIGLKNSIKSIKENFIIDLMIVDDGSEIIPDLSELEECYVKGRIYLEKLDSNLGIVEALNHGLNKIILLGYKYIGRLDTGDICFTNRFKEQLDYLKLNRDVKLLGTQVNFVNKKGEILYKSNLPCLWEDLTKAFYINCFIIHPTIVFESKILEKIGFYPSDYEAAEDYAFFFKILKNYKSENINKILLDVVIDKNGISVLKRKEQIRSKINIILDNFYFGVYPLYGVIRNYILLYLPYNILHYIKKIFFKK